MMVKVVIMDVNKLDYLQDLLNQTGQENKQLTSNFKKMIEFIENLVEKLQKSEVENEALKKDRNNMRAVIATLALSLGEEESRTIEDLKR